MADVYIGEIKIHPAAQMFPEMGQDDLDILYESIKRDGVQKPIVMYRDEVVDGRNRVRAARIAGIPFKQLPKVHLPDDADPYRVAWMANCERLDYQKSQKAEIHARILEESGKLETMRKQAEESRREKGREAAKKQHAPRSAATEGVRHVAETHKPAEPKQNTRKNSVAAQAAREAGVSQRTMERVLSKAKSNGGTRIKKAGPHDETWRVPRSIRLLAVFLLQKLPSDDIRKLTQLLLSGGKEEAA